MDVDSTPACGRLVVITGLPGSGKTTLAAALADSMPACRMWPDDWMMASGIDLWDESAPAQIEAAGRPDDLLVSTRMCRGNFKSSRVASGGYEYIAVRILGGLDVDACFLEFDSERGGGFERLRFLRRTTPDDGGGRVVAGEPGLGASRH